MKKFKTKEKTQLLSQLLKMDLNNRLQKRHKEKVLKLRKAKVSNTQLILNALRKKRTLNNCLTIQILKTLKQIYLEDPVLNLKCLLMLMTSRNKNQRSQKSSVLKQKNFLVKKTTMNTTQNWLHPITSKGDKARIFPIRNSSQSILYPYQSVSNPQSIRHQWLQFPKKSHLTLKTTSSKW